LTRFIRFAIASLKIAPRLALLRWAQASPTSP